MPNAKQHDVGLEVIRNQYKNAKVDACWSIWDDDGYTWWGHHLAQRIWRDKPVVEAGDEIWIVRARTDLAARVPDEDETYLHLAQLNSTGSTSSLVFDPEQRTMKLHCSFPVIADFAPAAGEAFSWAAAVQAATAEMAANSELLKQFSGVPDVSAHPVSGSRDEADDMLNIIANAVVPLGRSGALPTQEAFKLIKELPSSPSILTNYSSEGLVAEFPFPGGNESRDGAATGALPPTALLKISAEEPHPVHGFGWWVRLFLPVVMDDLPAARLVNDMNRFETTARAYLYGLGSWCLKESVASPDLHLCHSTFGPAVMGRSPWLLVNLFMNKYVRMQLVQEQFKLEAPSGLSAAEIDELLVALADRIPKKEQSEEN